MNLLSNALKFTFTGGVTVRLRAGRRRRRADRSRTPASASSPADQERLFERFHRVVGARSRSHEGTGVGPRARRGARGAARRRRGRPQSRPGRARRSRCTIPFGAEHLPADQVVSDPAGSRTPSATPRASSPRRCAGWTPRTPAAARPLATTGERPRVLVVDDNADMRVLHRLAARRPLRGADRAGRRGRARARAARAARAGRDRRDDAQPRRLRAARGPAGRPGHDRHPGDHGLRARGRGRHDRGPRGGRRRLPDQAVRGARAARARAREHRARPCPPHPRRAAPQRRPARPGAAARARRQLGDRSRDGRDDGVRGVPAPGRAERRGAARRRARPRDRRASIPTTSSARGRRSTRAQRRAASRSSSGS